MNGMFQQQYQLHKRITTEAFESISAFDKCLSNSISIIMTLDTLTQSIYDLELSLCSEMTSQQWDDQVEAYLSEQSKLLKLKEQRRKLCESAYERWLCVDPLDSTSNQTVPLQLHFHRPKHLKKRKRRVNVDDSPEKSSKFPRWKDHHSTDQNNAPWSSRRLESHQNFAPQNASAEIAQTQRFSPKANHNKRKRATVYHFVPSDSTWQSTSKKAIQKLNQSNSNNCHRNTSALKVRKFGPSESSTSNFRPLQSDTRQNLLMSPFDVPILNWDQNGDVNVAQQIQRIFLNTSSNIFNSSVSDSE